MPSRPLALLASLALCIAAPSQLAITTVYATPPTVQLGYQIASIGDVDGNGRPDLLIASFSPTQRRVQLISSTTFAVLGTVIAPSLANFANAGDVDLDGKSDFVVVDNGLRAYSGNGAALLWVCALPYTFFAACGISDVDGDGKPDVAAVAGVGSANYLVTLHGTSGAQIGISTPLGIPSTPNRLLSVGDVDADGKVEVACADQYRVDLYRTSPVAFMRTFQTAPATYVRAFAGANIAGDSRKEVLLSDSQGIYAYSAASGALLRTYTNNDQSGQFTVVGDLDSDGFDDLARFDVDTRFGYTPKPSVQFVSGATGGMLANWSEQYPQFRAQHLVGTGDVNGDGFGDLLLGDENASPTGLSANANGGWQLVSCKVLAATMSMPVFCGGGPFLPELGTTRPILGQTMTIVGRDAPVGAIGVLAFSLRPDFASNLGFSGCDAWLGADWSPLHMPPALPTWTFSLSVPSAAQLAGVQLAMQAFYVGTASPIGIDLTNGIWMRLGF